MPGQPASYKDFRQRLDNILRQKDPARLEAFMLEEGQWEEGQARDVEAAMWMMILGSQTLPEMRGEAERWLISNGHELEAQAILGRRQATTRSPSTASTRSAGGRPRQAPARQHGGRTDRSEQGGKPRAPRRQGPRQGSRYDQKPRA